MVHIYNGILLSHKRIELESVVMRWMNVEPVKQNKSEKEKQILYINIC